jgi:hypothetical protein
MSTMGDDGKDVADANDETAGRQDGGTAGNGGGGAIWPWVVLAAVVLIGGAVWQRVPPPAPPEERRVEQVAPFDLSTGLRALDPAPTVHKGKPVKVKGKLMARFYVGQLDGVGTDPGDLTFKGWYEESGLSPDGIHPAYVLDEGGPNERWLYYGGGYWCLHSSKSGGPGSVTYNAVNPGGDLPANPWGVDFGTIPAPTLAAEAAWIRIGADAAEALLWDDATKHRYSKYGDDGGGYKNMDTGVSGDGPASLDIQFEAPSITGGYYAVLKCEGYVWHTEYGLQGGEGTIDASLACKVPWGQDGTWLGNLGTAGAKALTLELQKASDSSVVATDTAGFTMFVPAVSFTSPAPDTHIETTQVTVGVEVDEWWAPTPCVLHFEMKPPSADLLGDKAKSLTLPTLTGTKALTLDTAQMADLEEFTLQAGLENVTFIDGATWPMGAEDPAELDLVFDEAYGIAIDSPQTGVHLPWPEVNVSGHLTGAVKHFVRLVDYAYQWLPVAEGGAAEFWSLPMQWSGAQVAVALVAQQGKYVSGTWVVLAEAAVMGIIIDEVVGGGGGSGGGGGGTPTTPTVTVDLPAEGATVGPEFTALINYGAFAAGSGTLEITLIGGGNSYTLLSAARTIVAGGGTYAEALTMPEGLAEAEYTLLARLTSGAETDSDSHQVVYDAGGPAAGDPPVVVITAPADAASVAGAVEITATATDEVGIWKMGLYVDGMLQQTIDAPANGVEQTFTWASGTWANGEHEIMVRAWDVALQEGNDTITVNLVNTKADQVRVCWTGQLGTDADNVPINADSSDFGDIFMESCEVLYPRDLSSYDISELYNLQVGYAVPGGSHTWGDMRIVERPGRPHSVTPQGRTIEWMMCKTPRQTAARWAISAANVIRLGVADGILYALATEPAQVWRLNLATGALGLLRDLDWLTSEPVDMAVLGGTCYVAWGEMIEAIDTDTGELDAGLLIPRPDVVTAITALAVAGDDLAIAATLAAGGSKLYRYAERSLRGSAVHEDNITALAAIGQGLMAGTDGGDVLLLSGTAWALQHATGEAVIRRLAAHGTVIYAGSGDSGKLYRKLTAWALDQNFGWDELRGLAVMDGWLWAGGIGTGGQYLWRQGNGGWVQSLGLEDAVGVNDLVTAEANGAEQLFAAVQTATGAAIHRVEIAEAGREQQGPGWPDRAFTITRTRVS